MKRSLHRACLLWIDYLRAETEREKQAYLYEAACQFVQVSPRGDEGEEVIQQVWQAIRRRELGRAFIDTGLGQDFVVATDDGRFAIYHSLPNVKVPMRDGV